MRRSLLFAASALAGLMMIPTVSKAQIVISQVYGGAGCGIPGCASYRNDYVEVFNAGSSPTSLSGLTIQYAASTGTSWQVATLPGISLQPGQYALVAFDATAFGDNAIPTPDQSNNIAMSGVAAKLALVSGTAALSSSCPTAGVLDFVGYGFANCSETSAASSPGSITALLRAGGGCTDTNNNANDFTVAPANPRNTASALNPCSTPIADNTPPTVVSITPGSTAPSSAPTETFTITFDEPVTGVDVSDFLLITTGTATGSIASVSGSNTTFSVLVSGISGSGTLRVDLSSNSGIQDASGNALAGGFISGGIRSVTMAAPPTPVPTLSEWAFILLATMLAGLAALRLQRQERSGC